jgi:hypothetical protein
MSIIKEDLPTNNAGSGNIDGIGVGPKGEPGIKKVKLINKILSYKRDRNVGRKK